jgi:hypothetical protein
MGMLIADGSKKDDIATMLHYGPTNEKKRKQTAFAVDT